MPKPFLFISGKVIVGIIINLDRFYNKIGFNHIMKNIAIKKENYKEVMTAYSLLGLVPPLGMLFIIVNWARGEKVNAISVAGLLLGMVLTVVYYLQLTNQM